MKLCIYIVCARGGDTASCSVPCAVNLALVLSTRYAVDLDRNALQQKVKFDDDASLHLGCHGVLSTGSFMVVAAQYSVLAH